jgi:hypothetical protein
MASTTSRGNYYKRKTKDWYEKLGYTVQLTEFMCATVIKGKCFYRKIDIFGSDGISMNGKEIIFWNSKATTPDRVNGVSKHKSEGKLEFQKYPFPEFVKRHIVIWEPNKKPQIVEV